MKYIFVSDAMGKWAFSKSSRRSIGKQSFRDVGESRLRGSIIAINQTTRCDRGRCELPRSLRIFARAHARVASAITRPLSLFLKPEIPGCWN